MVTGYAALDEYGRQVTPTLIDSVTGPDGNVLYQAAEPDPATTASAAIPTQPPSLGVSGAQLADPYSVFQDITMMKGRGSARHRPCPPWSAFEQPVAGKTGTTNNFNDAWFIGFTPGMLAGCWIGFDTPTSLGKDQTGGNVCGPIWNEFMKVALKDQPDLDFAAPPGMSLQQTSFNGETVTEAFKPGQTPGAQTNDGLLAGAPSLDTPPATPASQPVPGAPPTPTTSPADIDKSLGGLY